MNFFLLNTDKRLVCLHKYLNSKKFSNSLFSFEEIASKAKSEDIIILPPNFKWDLNKINALPKKITLVSGKANEEVKEVIRAKEIKFFNLMEDETFVLKNAILTAEGFLLDLIQNTSNSIFEQKILILGGGRVAKAVASILNKLGISFYVSMRNNLKLVDFQIFTENIVYWNNFKNVLKNYDVIINTIPFEIFNKDDVKKLNKNCTIFELSSVKCLSEENLKNFTVIDPTIKKETTFDNLKTKKFVFCPGIPGRYIPETSGKLILDFLKTKNII